MERTKSGEGVDRDRRLNDNEALRRDFGGRGAARGHKGIRVDGKPHREFLVPAAELPSTSDLRVGLALRSSGPKARRGGRSFRRRARWNTPYSVSRLPLLMVAMGRAICVFFTSDWTTLEPEKETTSAIMGMNEL
jgi:hypothetical protein